VDHGKDEVEFSDTGEGNALPEELEFRRKGGIHKGILEVHIG